MSFLKIRGGEPPFKTGAFFYAAVHLWSTPAALAFVRVRTIARSEIGHALKAVVVVGLYSVVYGETFWELGWAKQSAES